MKHSIHDGIKKSCYLDQDFLFRESIRHSNGAMGVTVDMKVDGLLTEMSLFSEKGRYDDATELVLLHESITRIQNNALDLYDTINSTNDEALILYTEAKLMGVLKSMWTKSWGLVIKLKDIVVKFFTKVTGLAKKEQGELSFSKPGFKISHEYLLKSFPVEKAKGIIETVAKSKPKNSKMGMLSTEGDAKMLIKAGITGDGSDEDITKLLSIICAKVTVSSASVAKDTMYQGLIEQVFGGGISNTFMDLVGLDKTKESKEGVFSKKTSDRTLRDVVRMSLSFGEENKKVAEEYPILQMNTVATNDKAGLKLPTEKTIAFYNNAIDKDGSIKALAKPLADMMNALKALTGGVTEDFTFESMAEILKAIDEYNTANTKVLTSLKGTLGTPKATSTTEDLMKAIDMTLGFCFEVFMGKSDSMLDWPIEKVLNGLNEAGIILPGNISIAQLSALVKYNNIDLLLRDADKEIGAIDGEKVENEKPTTAVTKYKEADNSALKALADSDKKDSSGASNSADGKAEEGSNADRFARTAEQMKKSTMDSDANKQKQAEADAKKTKEYDKSQDKLIAYLKKVRTEREKIGAVQNIADISKIEGIKKSIEYIAKIMGDFPYDNNFKSVKSFIQIEGASTKLFLNTFNTIKESLIIIKDINESTRSIPGDLALRIWGITKLFAIASDSYTMVQKVKASGDMKDETKKSFFTKKKEDKKPEPKKNEVKKVEADG